MANEFLHGLSSIVLTLPLAFGLQHNTRLCGTEIEQETAGVMRYNGWLHVVGGVTPNYKECKAEDLDSRMLFTSERRYICNLYFEEMSTPATFSIRVSYNAHEDADLIAAMDAVFLEGKYDQRARITNRVNYSGEVIHLGIALEKFDTAQQEKKYCELRAFPNPDKKMVLDTLVCEH